MLSWPAREPPGAELVGELQRYEDSYRLCYVRGPEGIIVELTEQIGTGPVRRRPPDQPERPDSRRPGASWFAAVRPIAILDASGQGRRDGVVLGPGPALPGPGITSTSSACIGSPQRAQRSSTPLTSPQA